MKKQTPGYSPAYGYPSSSRGAQQVPGVPNNSGPHTVSNNLPSIFDSPGVGGGVMLPLRHRPDSGLQLDVKGLPNSAGLFFTPTVPRERPDRDRENKRLSSSDTTADQIRQARLLHTSHSSRYDAKAGQFLHQRRGSHPVVPRVDNLVKGSGGRMGGATQPLPQQTLTSITRRPPSSVLPPIIRTDSVESSENRATEIEEEEEDEGSIFGREVTRGGGMEKEESGSTTESETDSDDEV